MVKSHKDSEVVNDTNSNEKIESSDTNSKYDENLDPLGKILRTKKGKYVKKFLDAVESEINKFFLFFLELENKLYTSLSKEISKEFVLKESDNILDTSMYILERLQNLSNSTLELCNFVNLNITAIRKILKKFDKKFTNKELPVSFFFLQNKLNNANSSLVYVLQFKTIDETSAILDDLSIKYQKEILKCISEFSSDIELSNMLNENLLHQMKFENLIKFDKNEMTKFYKQKFKKIDEKLEEIDLANQLIRCNIDIWSIMAKENIKMVNDRYDKGNKNGIAYIENEKILENLTKNLKFNNSNKQKWYFNLREYGNKEESVNSAEIKNLTNIWLLLIHSLLYTMNQYIILPTMFLLLENIGYNQIWVGLVISAAPFGSMVSQNFYSKNQQTYKIPLFISCSSFILGNFLYFSAFYHKSLIMILLSRFLIGVGGARSIIRKYFREQISNDLISYYSFFYISLVYIGIGVGALIGLIINLLNENTTIMIDQTINIYNYCGFIPLLIWATYTLFFLFLYNENVGITIKESHDADINLSTENRISSSNSYKSDIIERKDDNVEAIVDKDIGNKTLKNYKKDIINKEINDLIENHRTNLTSYMNISYFTLVLLFLIIRVRVILFKITTENILVYSPILLHNYHGFSINQVCLYLICFSLFSKTLLI